MDERFPSADEVLLSFQEFLEEPSLMRTSYCNPIRNPDDIKRMTYITTDKAIQELLNFCKSNPSVYKDILQKRKLDAIQSAGFFSSLKAFVCKNLLGKKYLNSILSDEEFEQKFSNLLRGIEVIQAHNRENFYKDVEKSSISAESGIMLDLKIKNRIHTFNDIKDNSSAYSRVNISTSFCRPSIHSPLSARKNRISSVADNNDGSPVDDSLKPPTQNPTIMLPPPPPPPPMNGKMIQLNKILTPRKRKVEQTDLKNDEKKSSKRPNISKPTKLTFHDEILKTNHKNRLRSTNVERSPGGTPLINPSIDNPNEDDLASNLKKVLMAKFANIRSPDQSASSSFNQSYNSFTD